MKTRAACPGSADRFGRTLSLILSLSVAGIACSDDTGTGTTAGSGAGASTTGVGAAGAGGSSSTTGTASGAGGAGAGGSGAGGSGAATSTGSTTGTGGTGGATPCEPACAGSFICCNGECVNPGNDIRHCGDCGIPCEGGFPHCDNGTCGQAPCEGTVCLGTQNCCGATCCDIGELCCVVPGPVQGSPICTLPNDNGTCDPGCPDCVCASPESPIATPTGERPISEIQAGDLVFSVDQGKTVAVPVLRVNRARVTDHRVIKLTFENGRTLAMSALHPTADGRTFGELNFGDELFGLRLVSVESIPYEHEFTYDILPASDTGAYFAADALVGSTLLDR